MVTGDQNSWMVLSSLSSSKRPVNDGAGVLYSLLTLKIFIVQSNKITTAH